GGRSHNQYLSRRHLPTKHLFAPPTTDLLNDRREYLTRAHILSFSEITICQHRRDTCIRLVMTHTSAPLAIAAVTAVLKHVLSNGLVRYSSTIRLGDVAVSVLPPDRITVGADESSQLNVYLYRVTPHPKLSGAAGARTNSNGRSSRLVLDLHYVL